MSFDDKINAYAELVVKVGLNLQQGQRLLIRGPLVYGAPFSAAPLIRAIARTAYQAGARLVDVIWGDEQMELIRFNYAPKDSFTEFSEWKASGPIEHVKNGDAVISVNGMDPDLLKGQDPDKVTDYTNTSWKKLDPFLKIAGRHEINWLVIAVPTQGWADKVFPREKPEARVDLLWETIFNLCRLDQPDPLAAWQKHIKALSQRAAYLNEKQYRTFKYRAPGTDLTVGLPEGHLWSGASSHTTKGFPFTANLPTEEVYSLPSRDRVDGVVQATLPLNYSGTVVDGINLRFEKGRIVNASATEGEAVLKKLIETDEGASRLGEVAIVPHNSPIAQSGLLFYTTLLDENAACHLALGSAYKTCLTGGDNMTDEQFMAAGGNNSMIHVDFMIGSNKMDIDGITADGVTEPVLRKGEWTFEV